MRRLLELAQRHSAMTIACFMLLLTFDRLLKYLSVTRWDVAPVMLAPGVQLSFFLNDGIAFSLPLLGTWAYAAVLAVVGIFFVWWIAALLKQKRRVWLPLTAVLLGAGSNLFDRFAFHGVIDYLQLFTHSFINLADLLILFGVALLIAL